MFLFFHFFTNLPYRHTVVNWLIYFRKLQSILRYKFVPLKSLINLLPNRKNKWPTKCFFHPLLDSKMFENFTRAIFFYFYRIFIIGCKNSLRSTANRMFVLLCFYLNRKSSRNDQFQLNLGKLHRKNIYFFVCWFTCSSVHTHRQSLRGKYC